MCKARRFFSREKQVFPVGFSLAFPRFPQISKNPTKYQSSWNKKHSRRCWQTLYCCSIQVRCLNTSCWSLHIQYLPYCNRNRYGEGLVCCIGDGISCNAKSFFPSEFENDRLEISVPYSKPINVGIVYCPSKIN